MIVFVSDKEQLRLGVGGQFQTTSNRQFVEVNGFFRIPLYSTSFANLLKAFFLRTASTLKQYINVGIINVITARYRYYQ